MRCFYVLKKWSSAKLSLNRDLSLNKMSLNRDCTVQIIFPTTILPRIKCHPAKANRHFNFAFDLIFDECKCTMWILRTSQAISVSISLVIKPFIVIWRVLSRQKLLTRGTLHVIPLLACKYLVTSLIVKLKL